MKTSKREADGFPQEADRLAAMEKKVADLENVVAALASYIGKELIALDDTMGGLGDRLCGLEKRIDDLHISGIETDSNVSMLEDRLRDGAYVREGQIERVIAALEKMHGHTV